MCVGDKPDAMLHTPKYRVPTNVMPFADLADVRLHYRFDGPVGAPVLMLSNSLGTDLAMWEAQMPRLTRDHRVLRYDTRGHGQSAVPPGPYTIAHLGRDVVALLDHLALDRVTFCGLSLGGMTGMWLGIHAKARVARLVLANTTARIARPDLYEARIAKVNADGMAAIAGDVLPRWFTPQFIAREPATVATIKTMLERTPAAGYVACCAAVRDMDQRDLLPKVKAPTLVVAGKHDPATPPEANEYIKNHIPGAQFATLDAAHISNVEQPDAYAKTVLEFLLAGKR